MKVLAENDENKRKYLSEKKITKTEILQNFRIEFFFFADMLFRLMLATTSANIVKIAELGRPTLAKTIFLRRIFLWAALSRFRHEFAHMHGSILYLPSVIFCRAFLYKRRRN
jgi:hypothetical protein